MSLFCLSARPAEYRNGYVLVAYSGKGPEYRHVFHATKLPEIEHQVIAAREACQGKDLQLYVRVLEGRKPNGFDRWQNENRSLFQLQKAVDTCQPLADDVAAQGGS